MEGNHPLLSPQHHQFYIWIDTFARRNNGSSTIAGGAALAQIANSTYFENLAPFEPSDLDIFICCNSTSFSEIEKELVAFTTNTGIPITPKSTTAMHQPNQYSELAPRIKFICDFWLHYGRSPTRESRLKLPVQLIVMREYPHDEEENYCFNFWKSVIQEFDINIVRIALPCPQNLSLAYILNSEVLHALQQNQMTYYMRNSSEANPRVMAARIQKYQLRGFRLVSIEFPHHHFEINIGSGEINNYSRNSNNKFISIDINSGVRSYDPLDIS